mgnify:CR=1 FL=1
MSNRFQFQAMRTATDSLPEGSEDWLEGMSMRVQYTFDQTEKFGVEPLVENLRRIFPYKPWNYIPKDKPCKRADEYFEGVTGRPWKILLAMIQEYDSELAKQIEIEIPALNKHGGDRKSDNQVDNVNLNKSKGGNSKEYILARLNRDYPEIAQDLADGQYKSVREAAKAAGLIKQESNLDKIKKLIGKLNPGELEELQHYLVGNQLTGSYAELNEGQEPQKLKFDSSANIYKPSYDHNFGSGDGDLISSKYNHVLIWNDFDENAPDNAVVVISENKMGIEMHRAFVANQGKKFQAGGSFILDKDRTKPVMLMERKEIPLS